jgi:hypothetical protein
MLKRVCDYCEKVLPEKKTYWHVTIKTVRSDNKPATDQDYDLCWSCTSDLRSALRKEKEAPSA